MVSRVNSSPGSPGNEVEIETERRFAQLLLHQAEHELNKGDTLVLIDFPKNFAGQMPVDCYGFTWTNLMLFVSSDKIRKTGSGKLEGMLEKRGQRTYHKVIKRGVSAQSLDRVKYFLDLSPTVEGDGLVWQMTHLSLTPGIIRWFAAVEEHGVDAAVVGGHDDACNCWKHETNKDNDVFNQDGNILTMDDEAKAAATGQRKEQHHPRSRVLKLYDQKAKGETLGAHDPAWRVIPDYCPIRHRVNILRLLYLIEGRRILVDSAPRLFTLVSLAKIFDCTDLVRDLALQWMLAPDNGRIVEVLPEECLQFGMTLRLVDIVNDSFRILVNEHALELAGDNSDNARKANLTVFGRKRQNLDGALQKLVQHAAGALVERVTHTLQILRGTNVYEDLHIPDWEHLMVTKSELIFEGNGKPKYETALLNLLDVEIGLRTIWQEDVLPFALKKKIDDVVSEDLNNGRATYVEPQNFETLSQIYYRLNDVQKLLCPFFYDRLKARWMKRPYLPPLSKTITKSAEKLFAIIASVANELSDHNAFQEQIAEIDSNNQSFDLVAFGEQVGVALALIHKNLACRTDSSPRLAIGRHLLPTLTLNEYKFLPLWAGGFNDGTGGVFERMAFLPVAGLGPAGPGPAFHAGLTVASGTGTAAAAASIVSDLGNMTLEDGNGDGDGDGDGGNEDLLI